METANYVIEWVLAGVSLIGSCVSVGAWLRAKMHSKKAEAEAEKAKEYADNANAANLSAKEYYDKAIQILDIEKEEKIKRAFKEKIRREILLNGMCKTSAIAKLIDITEDETFTILEEMFRVDKSISAAGQVRRDNLQTLTWVQRSK